jgi:hypothetical protein
MLRQSVSEVGRRDRRNNFLTAIIQVDFSEVLSFLDGVFSLLIDENPDTECFETFVCQLAPTGLNYRKLLSPINKALYQFLIENDQEKKAYFLAIIAQFLRFARKLEFQDIGLEAKALADYMETEQELADSYDDQDNTIDCLSKIVEEWFKGFHINNLLPSHGSGSVAEGPLTLSEKYHAMNVDRLVIELLRSECGSQSDYLDYFPIQPSTDLIRRSRTIFVSKTASKLRTISMEPATLQYIQQGVMHELYSYIDRHPYLGCRIRLDDQTQNQVMAWEGSYYRNYGTIDLSAASDRVSWALVRKMFRRVPSLFKWLLATRSSSTLLPTGETIELRKFAPMGSALCFPIECIVFASIVEHACRKYCKQNQMECPFYTVYGDDLVVPHFIYDDVIALLIKCGFKVNETKSYNFGPYRESCGKEYYAGVDISVLLYRIPAYRSKITPSAYSSLCSAANLAAERNFDNLRSWYITRIFGSDLPYEPYFSRYTWRSPCLYSPQPTNYASKAWFNRRLQRFEGKFCVVKSKRHRNDEELDDILQYHEALIALGRRSSSSKTSNESSFASMLHGTVEYFSSTVMPINEFYVIDKRRTHDW